MSSHSSPYTLPLNVVALRMHIPFLDFYISSTAHIHLIRTF